MGVDWIEYWGEVPTPETRSGRQRLLLPLVLRGEIRAATRPPTDGKRRAPIDAKIRAKLP